MRRYAPALIPQGGDSALKGRHISGGSCAQNARGRDAPATTFLGFEIRAEGPVGRRLVALKNNRDLCDGKLESMLHAPGVRASRKPSGLRWWTMVGIETKKETRTPKS